MRQQVDGGLQPAQLPAARLALLEMASQLRGFCLRKRAEHVGGELVSPFLVGWLVAFRAQR
jgi:hypothetical protein